MTIRCSLKTEDDIVSIVCRIPKGHYLNPTEVNDYEYFVMFNKSIFDVNDVVSNLENNIYDANIWNTNLKNENKGNKFYEIGDSVTSLNGKIEMVVDRINGDQFSVFYKKISNNPFISFKSAWFEQGFIFP